MDRNNEFEESYAPLYPPMFHPEADPHKWRSDVARWAETIALVAKAGVDNAYQTVYATLAHQLYYHALPSGAQSIVDYHQARGDIDYKHQDQVTAVRQIVHLIAPDPPAAALERLIDSFNSVMNCQRRPNEHLNVYLSRFSGLAASYRMNAGLSSSSHVNEILAITLVNNARLSEEALATAKMQLTSLAQARKNAPTDKDSCISSTDLKGLREIKSKLAALSTSFEVDTTATHPELLLRTKLAHPRNELMSLTERLDTSLSSITPPTLELSVGDRILKTVPRCLLSFDDAVTVIQTLSFSHGMRALHITKGEIEMLVEQKIQEAFLAFKQNNRSNNNRSIQNRIRKSRFPR